jgi:hypothetical protein
MKLYEVVFWGSEGAERHENDEDTIYLVRAADFRTALTEVATNASPGNHKGHRSPLGHVVYEIGTDLSVSSDDTPRILRGPYYQCAYNHGWKAWHRKMEGSDYATEWEQEPI